MSWNGKNETLKKSLVSWKLSIIQRLSDWERRKLDTYSCKYINFGRSITQAFLQKHGKIHIFGLDQIVRWVIGSFEFLTRDYFLFVDWTRVVWATRVVPLYDRDGLPCSRKPKSFADVVLEVECAWLPWMFLTSFSVFSWVTGAPVQLLFPDFGLVISMMKNWFT